MKFRGIVTKLWGTIFVLVVLILLVFTVTLSSRLADIYLSHEIALMEEHNEQWAQILKSGLPDKEIQQKLEFWGATTHYKLTIMDKDGNIQFSTHPKKYPPGKKLKNNDTHDEVISTTLPVNLSSRGTLTIVIETSKHELAVMNIATRNILISLLAAFFLLSALMALIFSHWLSKPLISIKNAAIGIVHGDFDTKLELKRDDELGDLANSIDNLSSRLKRTINNLHITNKELGEVLQQWKEFLADVSHELRTPLFLISGYSEAILDGIVDDKKAKEEYLPVIHKETLRLQKLVNDLTRIEKSIVLNKVNVNLLNLIQETLKPFAIILKEKTITIKISEDMKNLPLIPLDPDKFGEVIFNLVDNALRYTFNGGTISLSGELLDNTQLKLTISDSGKGIDQEHLPYLFDRFYRVDKSRNKSEGGTGLGLAIVKKIVDLHNGKISVESIVGQGTTFAIIIPL